MLNLSWILGRDDALFPHQWNLFSFEREGGGHFSPALRRVRSPFYGPASVPYEPAVIPCGPAPVPYEPAVIPCGPASVPYEPAVIPCGPASVPYEPAVIPCGHASVPDEPMVVLCLHLIGLY